MPAFIAAPHVTHPAARLTALRAHPRIAVTIDTEGFPPLILSLRGDVTVTDHTGVVAEYAHAARRYLGEDAGSHYLASLDHPDTKMARIAMRPTWAALIDFQTRLPRGLGGVVA